MAQEHVTLESGTKMPMVGLGTWQAKPGEVLAAVKAAVDAGYRHVDCAAVYGNEKEVGAAFAEVFKGGLKREELFVTSKVWNTYHAPEHVEPACRQTLADLGLEYLDLYLIHWPISFEYDGDNKFPKNEDGSLKYANVHPNDTWKAMEELVKKGLVKNIGVSNFNARQIDDVLSIATIKPAVLQVEIHPYLCQKELIAHAKSKGLVLTAYSPLGSPTRPWAKAGEPSLMEDPQIVAIANKYNKTPAQVLIRFQVERGVTVIPKSATPQRIAANLNVFDFKLSAEDVAALEGFNRPWRACIPMVEVDGKAVPRDAKHPHYPFSDAY